VLLEFKICSQLPELINPCSVDEELAIKLGPNLRMRHPRSDKFD